MPWLTNGRDAFIEGHAPDEMLCPSISSLPEEADFERPTCAVLRRTLGRYSRLAANGHEGSLAPRRATGGGERGGGLLPSWAAPNLSLAAISRLTAEWPADYDVWAEARSLGTAIRVCLGRRGLPAGPNGRQRRMHAGAHRRDTRGQEGNSSFRVAKI